MVALLLGLGFVAVAVYSVLPFEWSPGWLPSVIEFLKGGAPIAGLLVGLVAIFVGLADIKDRREARREEEELKKGAGVDAET